MGFEPAVVLFFDGNSSSGALFEKIAKVLSAGLVVLMATQTGAFSLSRGNPAYTTDERGANGFNTTGQATVALYTIPRKSSCSMSATNLGSTGTISISLPQKFIGKEKCKLLYLSSASSDQNVEPKGFCYSMKA